MNAIKTFIYCVSLTSLFYTQTILADGVDLAKKIQHCSQVSQDKARLNCFDQLSIKPTVTVQSTDKVVLTAQQVDDFSKEHVAKTAEERANEILSISLTISKLQKVGRGQWRITFQNGQQWQQKDSTKLKLKLGDQIILTKGALSSVFLQKENTNKRIKVKRLK